MPSISSDEQAKAAPEIKGPSKGARVAMALPVIFVAGLLAAGAGGGLVLAGYGIMKSMGALVFGGLAIAGASGYVLPYLTNAIPEIINGPDAAGKNKTTAQGQPSKVKKRGLLKSLFLGPSRKKTVQPQTPKNQPKPPENK